MYMSKSRNSLSPFEPFKYKIKQLSNEIIALPHIFNCYKYVAIKEIKIGRLEHFVQLKFSTQSKVENYMIFEVSYW